MASSMAAAQQVLDGEAECSKHAVLANRWCASYHETRTSHLQCRFGLAGRVILGENTKMF